MLVEMQICIAFVEIRLWDPSETENKSTSISSFTTPGKVLKKTLYHITETPTSFILIRNTKQPRCTLMGNGHVVH